MEFASAEELSARIRQYLHHLPEVPEAFPVRSEYLLDGIGPREFARAFRQYRDMMARVHADMAASPDAYGLVAYSKRGALRTTRQGIDCMTKLTYALGLCGEVKDRVLRVSGSRLAEARKSRNVGGVSFVLQDMPALMERLTAFGFVIEPLSTAGDGTCDLQVTTPDHPDLVAAVKAFTLPRAARADIRFDFAYFNHRVFAVGVDEPLPFDDLFSASLLTPENREFVRAFIDQMAELGYSYGDCQSGWYHGVLPCQYVFGSVARVYQNMSGVWLYVYVEKMKDFWSYFDAAPERYRNHMLASIKRCNGCRKASECDHRTVREVDGARIVFCSYNQVSLPATVEDIPFAIQTVLHARPRKRGSVS